MLMSSENGETGGAILVNPRQQVQPYIGDGGAILGEVSADMAALLISLIYDTLARAEQIKVVCKGLEKAHEDMKGDTSV